ncbi:hypothetical protein RND81_13G078900 [Saponaria officinalis]|uniref:Uncharacterized protein n=1 Tax=Saponaria officinalis TaxID=3572 RepID=A0AAW1H0R5_SAPOF
MLLLFQAYLDLHGGQLKSGWDSQRFYHRSSATLHHPSYSPSFYLGDPQDLLKALKTYSSKKNSSLTGRCSGEFAHFTNGKPRSKKIPPPSPPSGPLGSGTPATSSANSNSMG